MINPYRGIVLNGRYYAYVPSSYREDVPLKNDSSFTQDSRTFSVQGGTLPSFSLTLALDSTYQVYAGQSTVGTTTWLGVSRKDDLKSFMSAKGASMPINFIAPDGVSYQVVPTGSMTFNIFNDDNPGTSSGVEYRVSLTLDASQ